MVTSITRKNEIWDTSAEQILFHVTFNARIDATAPRSSAIKISYILIVVRSRNKSWRILAPLRELENTHLSQDTQPRHRLSAKSVRAGGEEPLQGRPPGLF